MSFERAVRGVAEIVDAYHPGLQALKRSDRNQVVVSSTASLAGSINLDDFLQAARPNEYRWDYAIGLKCATRREIAIWAEFHPASSSHLDEVFKKHGWLKKWLATSARELQKISRDFVWVATGRVFFCQTVFNVDGLQSGDLSSSEPN